MGVFARGPKYGEDQPGDGGGLDIDLDLRACPACRRELHPWEQVCPDDGSTAVARASLPPRDAPPPAHLLADEDDEGTGGTGHA
jgi:hypothetical protein